MFAGLVGYASEDIPAIVMRIIMKVGLTKFVQTNAHNLSGGNKRKLCLAMALIGRPKVILIDEASAGVDPGSRKRMFNAIKDEGKDSALILTTHTLEEAELLCKKIAIMVDGQFKCCDTLPNI